MARISLGGPELEGFVLAQPGASVRLLVPPDDGELELPAWNGNVFLDADGTRATIRTLTPRAFDVEAGTLDVDIVLHGSGPAARWAASAAVGAVAALSGPGRGYELARDAEGFVLLGDESALPAIGQLLEWMPPTVPVEAHIEVVSTDAKVPLRVGDAARVHWQVLGAHSQPGDTLVAAVESLSLADGWRIWAAGEATSMQQIRQQLFVGRGVPRSVATVRGYWKHGRAGDEDTSGD